MRIQLLLFILIISLFYSGTSFAGVQYTVLGCPASVDVLINFQWRSTVNITVASNIDSKVLPETPSGVYSSFRLPAVSSSAGSVVLTTSTGTLQTFSCSAAPSNDGQAFNETFLLGLAGIVCGSLIAFAFARAGTWGTHD